MNFDKESKFLAFCGGGGRGRAGEGIQFSCGHCGLTGHGYRARRGMGGGVRAIILISVINDSLHYSYTHCYKFSSRYSGESNSHIMSIRNWKIYKAIMVFRSTKHELIFSCY